MALGHDLGYILLQKNLIHRRDSEACYIIYILGCDVE
jgi:hypothetical protein